MLILAGLGNPGSKYELNRHNFGFMAVDAIADRYGFGAERARFLGVTRTGVIEGPEGPVNVLALKPQTFMNESGQSVAQTMRFYKVAPKDVVVFHDELDLAPGRFRMKTGGGAAGHNGLRSVTDWIGADFRRARLGIGHPGDKDRVLSYVLANFGGDELGWVKALCDACAEAAPLLAEGRDERYQGEVLRLAPAEKADPRQAGRDSAP
ncbi:MAG TPA: aminoacyl-tRNA hydrolase [Caulobacteraceae bacterium]|nr:aminoacyl-tRNA hydrolase [Caulobacteraceae bacterium]